MGVGTNTTYFAGTHYEVTNGTVTKYYYAGSQRIAMRTNGTLNYLLGDHLGSTSLTTDANGQVISELRYKPWGETRYSSGSEQTKYTYTGQYSYVSDFGLHFYNARWYDSSLSRFAQADTIVPGGIQGLDRYAYTTNNPLRYTDPTGHRNCEEDGYNCPGDGDPPKVTCKRGEDHYCQTGNGANIDTTHYSQEIAKEFWNLLRKAWKTGATSITTPPIIVGRFGLEGSFSATYNIDFSSVKNEEQLAQIGAGIWWDLQQRFEDWEGTIGPGDASRGLTSFQNEDIPTTFLAYVAEVTDMSFREVMIEMGGAEPSTHTGGGTRNSDITCMTGGVCDEHTSRNNTIYFKVQGSDGIWNLIPYPESLNIVPIQDPQYYTYSSCSTTGIGANC